MSEELGLGVVTSGEVSESALGALKILSPRGGGRDKESHIAPPTRKRYFPHS